MWRLRFVIVPDYSLRPGFLTGYQEPNGTVAAEERRTTNAKRQARRNSTLLVFGPCRPYNLRPCFAGSYFP
jgi:hypothetical protein